MQSLNHQERFGCSLFFHFIPIRAQQEDPILVLSHFRHVEVIFSGDFCVPSLRSDSYLSVYLCKPDINI